MAGLFLGRAVGNFTALTHASGCVAFLRAKMFIASIIFSPDLLGPTPHSLRVL